MMPVVDYAYFVSVFPELSAIPSGVVDALNPVAQLYVSENVYGDATQYALALAIAHEYTLGLRKGGGQVTSQGIGGLNVSFASLTTTNPMQMTTYGMRLRNLGRMLRPGGVMVSGSPNAGSVPPFGGYQPTWTRFTTQWRP